RADVAAVADRVWYPIWDEGLHLGHNVCSLREALALAADDLDTATALLSARHVGGDGGLSEELADRGRGQWERRARRWLAQLGARGPEALRARLAEAARTIAWTSDDAWRRVRSGLRGPLGRVARRGKVVAPGVLARADEVEVDPATAISEDPVLTLRVAAAAA